MALYIPHSIFHLARLLYVGPETFGPHYVRYLSSYDGCFQCELRLKLQFFFQVFRTILQCAILPVEGG